MRIRSVVVTLGATALAALAGPVSGALANTDVTIRNNGGVNVGITCAAGTCTPSGSDAILDASQLDAALAGNTNITVVTTSGGPQVGNLVVQSANVLSTGGGQLTLQPAGTASFVGSSNLTGPNQVLASPTTTVNLGGTVLSVALRFTRPVTLTADTVVTASNTGIVRFDSTVDGAFSLNSSAGFATVFAGDVGSVTPLASITAITGNGITVLFSANITTTSGQQYAAAQVQSGSSIFRTTFGGVDVVGGGAVNSGLFEFTGTSEIGNIAGFGGSVSKSGTGTLRLRGGTNIIPIGPPIPISVTGGVLQLEAPANQEVQVFAGGTLTGVGAATGLTIAGGRLDPGSSVGAVGTTPNDGALNLNPGAGIGTLHVDVTTAATDATAATGLTTVTDAPLEVVATSQPPVGEARTIIANDGVDAVVGAFAGLPEAAELTSGGAFFRVSYVGGTGNDVTLTRIQHATTATLTQSSATSEPGVATTFTALVSGAGGTPGGDVQLRDGATVLGTATLAAGRATFSVATLAAGTHDLTVSYAGDVQFASATSAAVRHTIAAPTTTPPVDPTLGISRITRSAPCITSRVRDISFSYRLESAARVTYTLQRRTRPLTRIPRVCPPAAFGSSSRPTRFVTTSARTQAGVQGRNTVRLSRLTAVRSLAPGVYRVLIQGRRADGVRSATVTAALLVVRR